MPPLFVSSDPITLDHLLHELGDAVCVSDKNMVFKGANQRFASFYGVSNPADLLGKNAFDVYPDFRRSVFYEACSNTVTTGETTTRVGYSANLDTWVAIRCYRYDEDRYAMIVHQLSDSTDKSGYVGQHDTLTALPNRWSFEKDVNQLGEYKQSLVLAIIDIRHFRNLNKMMGNAAGDRCLMEVASRIKGAMRTSDRVYRVGDDQFLVMTTYGKKAMLASLTRVSEALARPLRVGVDEVVIQTHIGLYSTLPTDGGSDAFNRAERALSHAKSHKSPYAEYSPEMGQSSYDPLLIKEIKDALKNGEFEVYLQPQVDLIDKKTCGVETLIRWNHPKKGFLSPDKFLPFAEETGLIQDIDKAVLGLSFDVLEKLSSSHPSLQVSINLSAQTICDESTVALLGNLLKSTGTDPERVCIEITETSLMHDIGASQKVIEGIKRLGVQVAIDDFGSGYSSMAYLVRYPSQFLKIDREFIKNITINEAHRIMVRNMIGLAHGLGIGVVAEGVETQEECVLLETFGCDVVQGFLFSAPLAFERFREWLDARGSSSLVSAIR